MIKVGRDFWTPPSSIPCFKQVHLERIAQDHIKASFENLKMKTPLGMKSLW